MMRFCIVTAMAAALGFAPQALAADIGAPAYPDYQEPLLPASVYDWSGWYFGINAGGAWGDSRYNFGDGFSTGDFDVSGGLIGGTIGANWQTGNWVVGLEGDLAWTDIDGSTLCPNNINTCRTSNDWLGTARGRIGYAFDRFLPYVTGGVAFGNIESDIPGFGSSEGTEVGWTVGAGLEFAAFQNWTAKIEYLYVDLGEFDCNAACSAIPTGTVDLRANIVRVGLNYKFDWPTGLQD